MTSKIGIYKDSRNRNKPWVVRWFGEYNPISGKQKRYSKSFRIRREAEDYQARKKQEFDQDSPRDKGRKVTLGDFGKEWLNFKKNELKPATYDLYNYTFNRLQTHFGKDIYIQNITKKDAMVFISKQKKIAKGYVGKKLSDWSREQIKKYSKLIFQGAVQMNTISSNPFDILTFRKLPKKRWHRISFEEYIALLEAAPTLYWKAFYSLAYTAGARVSELFSLTWSNIDFEKGVLTISNREGTDSMPPFDIKDSEERRIPLPPDTIEILAELQNQAPEEVPYILISKERYQYIVNKWQQIKNSNKPWRNRYMVNNVLREFRRHYKRAGIKPVGKLTIHTIRKSCGQNWADSNHMNAVREWMGHSRPGTTMEYYNQVDRDHEKKAAKIIQQMIENAKKPNKN